MQAWVPEDFNLEVEVNGDIAGVNMKDTKLISKKVTLKTRGEDSTITTRRLRNDECTMVTKKGDIKIGSYIETGVLDMRTEGGNVTVSKRLGIGKRGLIQGANDITIGSVFSNMAHLPDHKTDLASIIMKDLLVYEKLKTIPGLVLHEFKSVNIDNAQGILSLRNHTLPRDQTVNIQAMESIILACHTPHANVRIGHLKSLHADSYIYCSSLDLTLSENFEDFWIMDLNTSKFIDPLGATIN